jgi:hypothetical protein
MPILSFTSSAFFLERQHVGMDSSPFNQQRLKVESLICDSGAETLHSAPAAHAEHVATFSIENGGDLSEMQAKM